MPENPIKNLRIAIIIMLAASGLIAVTSLLAKELGIDSEATSGLHLLNV